MIQVKFIIGADLPDLCESLNAYLKQVDSDDVQINYDHVEDLLIIVEHNADEHRKAICSECQHWQENSPSSLVGICQSKGHRKRFDCMACPSYMDFRR